MIQDSARKCRFCGEVLPGHAAPDQPPRRAGSGPACPRCGSRDLRNGPWPWYLGTIGAILVRAVVCNQCEHHFDARKPEADLARRKRNLAIAINGAGALGILAIIGAMVVLVMVVMK
jgi:hypothetical protein